MKRLKNTIIKNPIQIYIPMFFILWILLCDCWIIFAPKQTFSEEENRALETSVNFSLDSVKDGTFMKSAENFIGDHFPLRKEFISLNTAIQLSVGKRDLASDYSKPFAEGGVYFGNNSHLYEVLLPEQQNIFTKNADAIINLANNAGVQLYILPIPSGSQEQAESLPRFAPNHNQYEELKYLQDNSKENVQVIDLFDKLSREETGRDYYFKTDHHWDTYGAYVGYHALLDSMKMSVTPQSEFQYKDITEPFYGTLYSKVLYSFQKPDQMILPVWKNADQIIQKTASQTHQGIYWNEYLNKKDKYSVYLGGNQALTVVKNPSAKSGRLLILKDSFANSMIPYLATNFQELDIVDPRYYNADLYQYIKQNGITRAAAIYSIKQLSEVSIANKLAK